MIEEWRDIRGLEGKYQVSNLGNVRSLDRIVRFKNGRDHRYAGKMLKPRMNNDGYYQIQLCPDSSTVYTVKVHRLVAEAFVTNKDGLKEVNHIDEDKANNRADNLEWCDRLQNCNHGTRNARIAKSHGTPVMVGTMKFQSYKAAADFLSVASETVRCAVMNGYKCRGYDVRRGVY